MPHASIDAPVKKTKIKNRSGRKAAPVLYWIVPASTVS